MGPRQPAQGTGHDNNNDCRARGSCPEHGGTHIRTHAHTHLLLHRLTPCALLDLALLLPHEPHVVASSLLLRLPHALLPVCLALHLPLRLALRLQLTPPLLVQLVHARGGVHLLAQRRPVLLVREYGLAQAGRGRE